MDMALTNDEKRDLVLKWAESQLGVVEQPVNSNKVKYNDWYYGKVVSGSAYPWCMAFVQWVTKNFKPVDILFMHWGANSSVTEHVGIVKSSTNKIVVTYEGNTSLASQANGGCVMERNRAYANVTGAYRPWYNM
jgi:hypothetical protein